ncbi:protein TonB-like isoform X2 [Littorina saxatilis]|uniref:Uncharacterized protein n=1 Tax=Littorina saxatilis TaxID=31220 RepID=A0AAN9AWQ2_9CAEN
MGACCCRESDEEKKKKEFEKQMKKEEKEKKKEKKRRKKGKGKDKYEVNSPEPEPVPQPKLEYQAHRAPKSFGGQPPKRQDSLDIAANGPGDIRPAGVRPLSQDAPPPREPRI